MKHHVVWITFNGQMYDGCSKCRRPVSKVCTDLDPNNEAVIGHYCSKCRAFYPDKDWVKVVRKG